MLEKPDLASFAAVIDSKPVSCFSEFQQLEEVIVGRAYEANSVAHFEDIELRDMLQKIFEETNEDLEKLSDFLKSLGVVVKRPKILFDLETNRGPNNEKRDRVDLHQFGFSFPNQPLMPRDTAGVYGERILEFYTMNCGRYFDNWSTYEIFSDYFKRGARWNSMPPPILSKDAQAYLDYNDSKILYHAANILKCGKDLFISQPQSKFPSGKGTDLGFEWIARELGSEFRINKVEAGGHLDGKMAFLKPGVVAVWNPKVLPEKLKNWNVIKIPDTFGQLPEEFRNIRKKRFYKSFVERYLKEWIGYCDETIFDVNMFSVNEKLVITNGHNAEIYAQFKANGIEGWPFHFRHQHFWDGAVHCITLDTKRRGSQEDYF